MGRTRCTGPRRLIYRRTQTLRAVQQLLGAQGSSRQSDTLASRSMTPSRVRNRQRSERVADGQARIRSRGAAIDGCYAAPGRTGRPGPFRAPANSRSSVERVGFWRVGQSTDRSRMASRPPRVLAYAQHVVPEVARASWRLEALAASAHGARDQAGDSPLKREIRAAASACCRPPFCDALSAAKKR